MIESNINDCKLMGTCYKLRAYFNGDNRYMCCCDECEDFEPDEDVLLGVEQR